MPDHCEYCGAPVGDAEACMQDNFAKITAREYLDPAFGAVHLLTVDAYGLQHGDEFGPQHNAFTLLRLAWSLRYGGSPDIDREHENPMAEILDLYPDLPELEAPPLQQRGLITVASSLPLTTPDQHRANAYRWAESVYTAFHQHHPWITQIYQSIGLHPIPQSNPD